MQKNKIISLLSHFSSNDLTRFRKYVFSPFFNENLDLSNLLEALIPYFRLSNKTENLPDKLGLWQKIFRNEPYNDVVFRRLCSDLTKLAYGFLAYQQLKKEEVSEQVHLLEGVNNPKLKKHFDGVLRQIRNSQSQSGQNNSEMHYLNFLVESQQHKHLELAYSKANSFQNLEQADYHLDCFYISKKLKHFGDALGYKSFVSQEADIHFLPQFMDFVEKSSFMEEPAVKAYYLVIQMLQFPEDENHFFSLKQYLSENGKVFPKEELNRLYTHLKNYCIDKKINIGHSEYFHELFELYQSTLKNELIFEDNALPPNHYKNIITVGLNVKAFDWVEQFIIEYTPRLPKSNQENARNYNLAKVYFSQHLYQKVIEQLREVEYKNLDYALGGKLMLLKTYYELGEDIALDSLIDSFRIYLRRNRLISKEVRQQYLNVLRFVKKLSALAPYDKKGIEKTKIQIQNCKALADKNWILEKVEDLN